MSKASDLTYTLSYRLKHFYNQVLASILYILAKPRRYKLRKRLKNKNFTIISNNCWAAMAVYQFLGIKYNTPTVGLFFSDEDYLRFVERLDYYLNQPINFVNFEESKFYKNITTTEYPKIKFPIAHLDDVEILCMHYKSEKEFMTKWERRKTRINRSNIIIKFSIRDISTNSSEYIERIKNIPFKNKICFSPYKSKYQWVMTIPELHELNIKSGGDEVPLINKYVDVVSILNNFYR